MREYDHYEERELKQHEFYLLKTKKHHIHVFFLFSKIGKVTEIENSELWTR